MDPINARDLACSQFKANPYPFYARLRAEAPVCRVSVLHMQAWLVTRYDDVLMLLKDRRFSTDVWSQMPWLPGFTRPLMHNMLSRDAPAHTRLRTLTTTAFTPQRIEQLRPRIENLCHELLAVVPPGGRFDLVRAYALPVPLTIISDLLGIPERERRRFQRLTRGTLPLGAPTRVTDILLALPYAWLLLRYFRKLLADRRAHPRDDLITALVQAETSGDRLTENELLGTAILLLFAGYETTVSLIAGGALALLQHPQQCERFRNEPLLAESAIHELLRFTSPVEITQPRVAREDVEIASVTIRRGELVAAVLGSANHDDSQFVDPEALDIAREPNRHLAFGHGAHFCLGAPLAQLEGQIALTTLFHRFRDLRLAQPAESLRWRKMVPLRALHALPVVDGAS